MYSAGGLAALGICTRGWSVNEAIAKFKVLAKEVFKPRDTSRIHFLEDFTNVFHGNLYKTQTLENALKREFSNGFLFAGNSSLQQMPKVAVTSSSLFGKQAVILTNYNLSSEDVKNRPGKREQGSIEIEGLPSNLPESFELYLLIEEQDHPSSPALCVILSEAIIGYMKRGYFDLDGVEFAVSKEHSSINISLCLQTVAYASGSTSLPISGFPRQLISEDGIYADTSK
ncbi:hypothetical protein FHL15_005768 [Xylaria flabelliformis]|uniref:PNPLA domain-containing protein n=1 Tax=Xylaria flabelliformis TaxID=2512241 RepID=A0A553HZW9_9PEZI|nr:hypothetical protein FHL15_005768 [Xylaria flabelliformis]